MKISLLSVLLFFSLTVFSQKSLDKVGVETTTYFLIRHAEKDRSDKTNRDPHLIKVGLERADRWANVFKNVAFDMVYSTNYNRTKETALPTAIKDSVKLTLYDPRDLDFESFIETTKGKTVLIVGHSNTTPQFVNKLLGREMYESIADDNNANLYIVTLNHNLKDALLLVVD